MKRCLQLLKTTLSHINVTPDFIFGHLAKRGFEVEPDDTEEEKRTKEDEIQSRANLLMMYLLKALTPEMRSRTLKVHGYT